MFCSKCGKKCEGNEKFCVECGQPIPINRVPTKKTPIRKKSKPISLVLAVAAGIAVTLLTGYSVLCTYFLNANLIHLSPIISIEYSEKYGDLFVFWPKDLSEVRVKIKGDEAIVTGKYSKPNEGRVGEFIAYYDNIFKDFPDLYDLYLICPRFMVQKQC